MKRAIASGILVAMSFVGGYAFSEMGNLPENETTIPTTISL